MCSVAPDRVLAEMSGENIEEDADFRREMAAMGIDRINRQFGGAELGEDRNETTLGEIIGHQESWGVQQALAEQRRGSQRIATVCLEVAGQRHRLIAAVRSQETPLATEGRVGIDHAIVVGEI